ncbi:hypothetical protein [Sphingomonas crocodyli]|uniref:PEP-CTERM sorting domain-containing protein n=1 Tax=Sphingomonas crocodyli TaxID=1979270 RepID=A0A437LXZ0_9SPHN|nr:hypothetical protein [Sphingomonas crocodyli]RVT90193.1 hypothetical protein EOD43_18005 [Sphingomonas crocodyli]
MTNFDDLRRGIWELGNIEIPGGGEPPLGAIGAPLHPGSIFPAMWVASSTPNFISPPKRQDPSVTSPSLALTTPNAVPELSTWAMLLMGFVAIGMTMRRGNVKALNTPILSSD